MPDSQTTGTPYLRACAHRAELRREEARLVERIGLLKEEISILNRIIEGERVCDIALSFGISRQALHVRRREARKELVA
jgi:hypothetical protein